MPGWDSTNSNNIIVPGWDSTYNKSIVVPMIYDIIVGIDSTYDSSMIVRGSIIVVDSLRPPVYCAWLKPSRRTGDASFFMKSRR